jgi:hypothetical protein
MMIAPIWAAGTPITASAPQRRGGELAEALEQIFASGRHDFAEVAAGSAELRAATLRCQ